MLPPFRRGGEGVFSLVGHDCLQNSVVYAECRECNRFVDGDKRSNGQVSERSVLPPARYVLVQRTRVETSSLHRFMATVAPARRATYLLADACADYFVQTLLILCYLLEWV